MKRVGYPDYKLKNSKANIRRMKERLEDLQIVKSCKPWKSRWDHRKAYRIDYERLETLWLSNWQPCQSELSNPPNQFGTDAKSLTKTTSETNLRDNNDVVVEKVFENLSVIAHNDVKSPRVYPEVERKREVSLESTELSISDTLV